MKFSVESRDITPDKPVFLAGFGSRDRKSEGVLQPIFMKAVLMQANKSLLLVAIDATGADRSFVDGIKEALAERFGFSSDEILLNFSHSHSSVHLTGLDTSQRQEAWSIGQDQVPADPAKGYAEDEAYFIYLRDSLLEMVAACYQNLVEGELFIGSADTDFSISRRLPLPGGGIDFAPNPQAEIDRQLAVFKLVDNSGSLQCLIYSIGSHPTTLGSENYLIANDFVSYASAELERKYPGATVVFLQGCGAELKPRATVRDGAFVACDVAAVQAMGEALASEVAQVLQSASFDTVACHFNTALENCSLPAKPDEIEFYRNIMKVDEPGGFEYSAAARMLATRLEGKAKEQLPCTISVWQLDGKTHLVGIEGEASTEYALAIKNYFSKGNMVVLGYCNGVPCYIPTRKMIAEGGYEADTNYFYGLQGPFMPEIEDIIIGRVARLLYKTQ